MSRPCKISAYFQHIVEKTIGNAAQAQSSARKYAEAVCKELGLDSSVSIHMGKIKDPDRIFEKAFGRYNGDISKVGDVCRLQIFVNTPKEAISAAKLFFQGRGGTFHGDQKNRGIELIEAIDNMKHPTKTGWIGINVKLTADLGKGRKQGFEVQIIPSQMRDVYETTHTYLENIRALEDNAVAQNRRLSRDEITQIAQYQTMARTLHKQIAEEFGYSGLSYEGKPIITRVPTEPSRDFVFG